MFTFRNTILLQSFNACTLVKNVVIMKVKLKFLRKKFLVIISLDYFDNCLELILDKCKKVHEIGINLIFMVYEIYLNNARKIIYYSEKIMSTTN